MLKEYMQIAIVGNTVCLDRHSHPTESARRGFYKTLGVAIHLTVWMDKSKYRLLSYAGTKLSSVANTNTTKKFGA